VPHQCPVKIRKINQRIQKNLCICCERFTSINTQQNQ